MEIYIKDQDRLTDHEAEVTDRPMLLNSSALGILRHQLAQNIGLDRIKGFLVRFGYEMGVNDAKQALKTGVPLETLIEQGPVAHMKNGHIRGFTHECNVAFDEDHHIVTLHGRGTWIDSYEAVEHVKRIGLSDSQVCHTLIGYSNGFMTTICEQPVLTKEITCVGKGDSVCSWMTRTKKEWEAETNVEEELHYYHETPIMKELEYTYEQLLHQQKFVTQLSSFQTKLAEEISNGSDLHRIANIAYGTSGIPIVIEDTDFRTITYAGLTDDIYLELTEDIAPYIRDEKDKHLLPFKRKTVKTDQQERLISLILVQKKILGYCSFVYYNQKQENPEEDYLFLDRFSNAASIILLNEKTKFESFERMKGNFLEQILQSQLSAGEIIKRGKYANLDLNQPYYVVVMEYQKTELSKLSVEEEFYLQEQIQESIYQYFNQHKQQILIGQREGKLVFLIMKKDKRFSIETTMKDFYQFFIKTFPRGAFKLGISNEGHDIQHAATAYEEAMIALRLALRNHMILFDSLGIVGVLINSKNIPGIQMIAKKELGELYDLQDSRMIELMKTLYAYLSNGGKLEQTMSDLALSMSGLRHRIRRIEGLLDKDLRDPDVMYELLLIIQSLIAIGELKME
ncbi:XylR N-terminal domain-containing protein [Niallia sp. Krafla_26]|uniref:XylR N-terminal domain-containing protein n=1 Tax=Niallia sp. Krafla_26 TaxID=3064703 RepID=UPI003D16E52F